ncbi:Proteasome activator complex subunit 4 [Halotydeus destructor]|nr:Proteasome activator complex subunit 4 [Halotydeus destructor]
MDVDTGPAVPFDPQKAIVYNDFLPYSSALPEEAAEYLNRIKANISRALLLSDARGLYWIWDLGKYIRLYGRFFSKEDHLYFIRLLYQVVTIPDLELTKVATYASVLTSLLKKRDLISRDELSLEWRPLYELYERTLYSTNEHHHLFLVPDGYDSSLKQLIRGCRVYFPIAATQEILDQFRPMLCSFDSCISKGTLYLELFLPTISHPDEHHLGYKLWFDELMSLWEKNLNSPSWEQNLITLFARLGNNNVGFIDWTPYIPKIFTHLLKSFNLQGGTHKVQINRNYQVFDVQPVVHWIISMLGGDDDSLAIHHVEMLFKSLESYYHPSNIGRWNGKLSQLLYKLPSAFIRRLHRERYKKPTWQTPIPQSKHISEGTVTRFVNALKPIISVAMFSRYGSADSAFALQHLSVIRPEIVIPPLLELLYSSLQTVTEPHRLTATLQCAVAVGRSLVRGNKYYVEGPAHVIPLLMAALPGIDSNDCRKSVVAFQFISTFVTLIPLVDCTSAVETRDDLSETEYNLCLLTGQFEDFVLQFMDRCFALIENSAHDHRTDRSEAENMRLNAEEGITEVGLTSTFSSILTQCSPNIIESAIDKLHAFVANRIFETKVAGKFAANMCRACVKANPELSSEQFIPHFGRLAITLTDSEEKLKEEALDDELLFCLQLLSEVVRCDGNVLLKYKSLLTDVLERGLQLQARRGYELASSLLQNLLKSLTTIYSLDFRGSCVPWDEYTDFTKHLPIRDWGKPGDLHNLNVSIHVPSEQELAFANELLQMFLVKEMNRLTSWKDGKVQLERDILRRSLAIVSDCLSGAATVLPTWKMDEIVLIDMQVPINTKRVKELGVRDISPVNGNLRQWIGETMRPILRHILATFEDDTKSLVRVVKIYNLVLFFFGISKSEFDVRWKSFHRVKRALENKLIGSKQHIRALLVDRVILQHELRMSMANICAFTQLHNDLMEDLLLLSMSHYSEVRSKAQETLNICFRFHPYAYRRLLPALANAISKDSSVSHEEFKGALFVILGRKGRSILTVSDWETVHSVWISLVNAKHSEKPSIIRLLGNLSDCVQKYFETIWLVHKVPDSVTAIARQAWSGQNGVVPRIPCPTNSEIARGLQHSNSVNELNVLHYKGLVNDLAKVIEDGSLHWRYSNLAFGLLAILIRHDMLFPVDGVRVIVRNLIHESIYVRKICISWVGALLKQQKRRHGKKVMQLDSSMKNDWLQYDMSKDYLKPEIWKETVFMFKPYIGFYSWPKEVKVCDLENEPSVNRTRDELAEHEVPIYDFFNDQANVDKLLEYLSLEEKKGHDKFSTRRFQLFKGVFTNFGLTFLPRFEATIQKFVTDSHESTQRCASEFVAGIMRGSRHWSYEDNLKLREYAEPLFRSMLGNILPETVYDWGTCCATCFEREDARRLFWLVRLMCDDPLNAGKNGLVNGDISNGPTLGAAENKATSFLQSSRVYCLLGVVQQQEWRGLQVLNYLVDYLKADNHLTHSFQNVRERIGVLLTNIFVYDVDIPCIPGTLGLAPSRASFVDFLLLKLEAFEQSDVEMKSLENGVDESETSPEKKAARNLLKTVAKWVVQNFSKSSCSSSASLFKLLPILCRAQSETNDEELVTEAMFSVVVMSQAILNNNGVEYALTTAHDIMRSKSWHARNAIALFLQYTVSTNLFSVMCNEKWVKEVIEMILSMLEDERIEVRESAANTLGGLIHCEFIKVDKKMLNWMKKRAKHELKKIPNPKNEAQMIVDPNDLIARHAGILGLCAVINAFPYEVPDFMPSVLMYLADHLHDPQPIPSTIKKTLSSFKRTHHDNWRDHKLKFTDDQLVELTNFLVSPSYYA